MSEINKLLEALKSDKASELGFHVFTVDELIIQREQVKKAINNFKMDKDVKEYLYKLLSDDVIILKFLKQELKKSSEALLIFPEVESFSGKV